MSRYKILPIRVLRSYVPDVVRVSRLVYAADEPVADADPLEVDVGHPAGVILPVLQEDVGQGDDVGAAVRLAEGVELRRQRSVQDVTSVARWKYTLRTT